MKKLLKSKSGFTMVELMVVVIIVGILASAAIPLYRGLIKRAIQTEAVATLGAIRSQEGVYKSENGVYTSSLTADQIDSVLGANVTDAQYFDNSCYTVTGVNGGGTTFTAICTNLAGNVAPGAAQTKRYFLIDAPVITMNEVGVTTVP